MTRAGCKEECRLVDRCPGGCSYGRLYSRPNRMSWARGLKRASCHIAQEQPYELLWVVRRWQAGALKVA
jgi:hypothetical protein